MVARVTAALARHSHALTVLMLSVTAILIGLSSSGALIDEPIRSLRDAIRDRPASTEIHIIEIDAKSISERGAWPWRRSVYAELIARLKAEGVATIAFDVDFSAPSVRAEDQAFASGLAAFGGSVILPTFVQRAGTASDAVVENLPIGTLRDHAFLGAVNVSPDPDGQVRHFTYGVITGGAPRPSIPALLAHHNGAAGDQFRIDTAIAPDTIPVHSFNDVISGRMPRGVLAGKTVIIGATAIELGDRYAVPRHGVLPGVVVQVLAAETLIQRTSNESLGFWPMLVVAMGVIALIARRGIGHNAQLRILASALVITLCPLITEMGRMGSLEIAPALLLLTGYSVALSLLRGARTLRKAYHFDAETGLPNLRSMIAAHESDADHLIIAVRVTQFDELVAILDTAQRAALVDRVIDRLALTVPRTNIFLLSPGLLGIVLIKYGIESAIDAIEGLAALFRSSIDLGSRTIVVTLAFGLAEGRGPALRKTVGYANFAAARAADQGHNWAVHNDHITDKADLGQILLADVDGALENDDIFVVFQPKWQFASARIAGAEALVRWRHATLGPIGPDQFIPVLEQNGRLEQLTLHVFDRSVEQVRRWMAHGLDLGVAINISAPLFADADFVAVLLSRIEHCAVPPSLITLEITESATIASPEQTVAALKAVRALGAKISIDDYGTRQSTLTYLKTFPADEIKIDQSFITRMIASNNDQILVRSTIELAHQLGFKVVAEGIEEGECFDMLASYGCDTGQGWRIGKPVPADAFLDLVTENSASQTPAKVAPRA